MSLFKTFLFVILLTRNFSTFQQNEYALLEVEFDSNKLKSVYRISYIVCSIFCQNIREINRTISATKKQISGKVTDLIRISRIVPDFGD